MDILKEKILKEGKALNENVLKVDSFINHGVDPELMYKIGNSFKEYFKEHQVTKVITIESSGIAPAVMTALQMNLPMVVLKKQTSKILKDDVIQTSVHSFTKDIDYHLTLSKRLIEADDKVLIIDDFLANGEAAKGAINLIERAGATVAGVGIVIEKSFQPGRKLLENLGYEICSLAKVSRLSKGVIEFC